MAPTRARWSRRALLVVAVATTQCNCPGDPLPPGVLDASADASVPDGSNEAPVDATEDSRIARDAAGAEWVPFPGMSERCGMMVVDPATVHEALQFEICPGRAGCRQLVLDWEPNENGARFIAYQDTGYHDGEQGVFVFGRPDPDVRVAAAWWTVIATDRGNILAVFRHVLSDDPCVFRLAAVGEHRFAIELFMQDTSSRLFGGELSAPAATIREVAHFDPAALATGPVSFLRVGADQMAVNTTAYHAFRIGWDGEIVRLDQGGSPADAGPPSVVGRAIVFDTVQTRNGILVSDAGSPPVDLVLPPAPGAEPSIHDRTDGRTLAWLTGFDRVGASPLFFDRVELWASPFAPRAADLRPVSLASMRNSGVHSGVIGGYGHAAVVDDDARVIRFFRVADGHETELRAPAGLQWSGWVSFIGPREVMVSAGTMTAYSGQTAVQLIDYTALEPPL